MNIPMLPESAPFSSAQRAWLNGFFAGLVSVDGAPSSGSGRVATRLSSSKSEATQPTARAEEEESFPWHDPSLGLEERLELAKEKPLERRMMAAMAQLDCGACGYVCKTYSEA